MTRAEHKLLFPLLTPSHPFLLPQSYIFEKNFYLFSPPPVTCGVSPFATTKKALGFLFILTLTAVIIMSLELH